MKKNAPAGTEQHSRSANAVNRLSRRLFLEAAGGAAAVFSLSAAVLSGCSKPSPETDTKSEHKPVRLELALAEYDALTTVGGAVKIDNPADTARPLIVCRVADDSVAAYSSRCSHTGCEVELPSEGRVVCPCHDSVFDNKGEYVSGPAKGPLKQYPAKLQDMKIIISI